MLVKINSDSDEFLAGIDCLKDEYCQTTSSKAVYKAVVDSPKLLKKMAHMNHKIFMLESEIDRLKDDKYKVQDAISTLLNAVKSE